MTEKEIVDVIYEAGQMPIKTLGHFRARMGRDFMAKVYAVAESEQYEEDGRRWHPAGTTFLKKTLGRRERRERNGER